MRGGVLTMLHLGLFLYNYQGPLTPVASKGLSGITISLASQLVIFLMASETCQQG